LGRFYNETGEPAAALLDRSVWALEMLEKDLMLYSDNGAPMKSLTMRAKMHDLAVITS